MKKYIVIPFFVLTWFVCIGQPFSLVSPSYQDEPLIMLDNQGDFLVETPYNTSYYWVSSDMINHTDNCVEVTLGGSQYFLRYSEDCQWISAYDLYYNNEWVEGFVFIIAEDIIMYNDEK